MRPLAALALVAQLALAGCADPAPPPLSDDGAAERPAVAPAPQRGLGVSRQEAIDTFAAVENGGFRFADHSDGNRERFTGTAADRGVTIILYGPAENLEGASIVLMSYGATDAIDATDAEARLAITTYETFMRLFFPELKTVDAIDWLDDSMKAADPDVLKTTSTIQDREVTYMPLHNGSHFVRIEPISDL